MRTLAPEVPVGLELVVQRAMAREAGDRYQQMAELSEALDRRRRRGLPP